MHAIAVCRKSLLRIHGQPRLCIRDGVGGERRRGRIATSRRNAFNANASSGARSAARLDGRGVHGRLRKVVSARSRNFRYVPVRSAQRAAAAPPVVKRTLWHAPHARLLFASATRLFSARAQAMSGLPTPSPRRAARRESFSSGPSGPLVSP